jgi:hypothetical protein
MSDKPSYLSLLNAIALGERRGHAVLSAWRDATGDTDLAGVLQMVAIREQEHAAAFEKRLCELGYAIKENDNPAYADSLACARSAASDDEKFRRVLGYQAADESKIDDPLARVFEDRSIDPQTGALLGRFICEERDSERQLKAAWKRIADDAARHTATPARDDDPLLADIAARIDRLAATIEQFKQLRR